MFKDEFDEEYYNHTLQINPRHPEEEAKNTNSHITAKTSNLAPRLYFFFMLNSTEFEISTHKKLKYRKLKKFLALSLSDVVFIMLINVKMPTIVGILTFMSRINFVLS